MSTPLDDVRSAVYNEIWELVKRSTASSLRAKPVWSLEEVRLWVSHLKSDRSTYEWISKWAPRAQCGPGAYSSAAIIKGSERFAHQSYKRGKQEAA